MEIHIELLTRKLILKLSLKTCDPTILNGHTWTGEICNRRKNGELYWVKTYIIPVENNGYDTYFLSIRTDITIEKEKEILLQTKLLSSFETVAHHINNLVFKVEIDSENNYGFSLLTGKLASEFLAKKGLAEETGLIISIGKYVLEEACRQAALWIKQGVPFKKISVNISPIELEQNDFLANVHTILEKTGLPPH